MREKWKVNRSCATDSRARSIAGIADSMVVLSLGTSGQF
jgi:hypothetical protein